MSPAAPSRSRRSSSADTLAWRTVEPAPVMLLKGPEDFIAARVTDRIRHQLAEAEPDMERHRISAAEYQPGQLTILSSPSLFGEKKFIQIDDLHKMTDDFLTDTLAYLDDVNPDVALLMRHTGGNRGKKLLDALKKKAVVVECAAVSSERDKIEFLTQEFRANRRAATPEAVRGLFNAVGSDMHELASAASQLMDDVEGEITEDVVDRYYGGRVQATAFKVADAALEGRTVQALSLLRHALTTGVSPVAVTASMAMKARQVARIIDARIGQGQIAQTLGVAPWQAKRVAATARLWTAPAIADALEAIAQADSEVKGLARTPEYSVERMVMQVARSVRR